MILEKNICWNESKTTLHNCVFGYNMYTRLLPSSEMIYVDQGIKKG